MDNTENTTVLTFPEPRALALSIRATALVFEDPLSRALLARIRQIAPSEATALIIGDTGTGKELIARHVHALSRRAEGPFVAVNCAALPESWWKANCSAMKKALSPARSPPKPAGLKRRKAARCFWTKSAICPWECR